MKKRTTIILVLASGVLLLAASLLIGVQPAEAQCGSQASSCKTCHEVQAADPVNADGTTWHSQHAFGDFCYLCHAGNNQAMDQAVAHTGMVDPISDVVASCKGCHPNDFESLAQGYADTLGVALGTIVTNTGGSTAPTQEVSVPQDAPAVAVPAADMVDYSRRYDEVVLGKKPLNIGNLILVLMLAAMLFGGGYFIARREGIFKVSFQETKQIQGSYPADVVDLVPDIAKLKPSARHDLQKLLSKPARAAEALALLTKLMDQKEPPASQETGDEK